MKMKQVIENKNTKLWAFFGNTYYMFIFNVSQLHFYTCYQVSNLRDNNNKDPNTLIIIGINLVSLKALSQLIVKLCTYYRSIFPSIHNQLIRNAFQETSCTSLQNNTVQHSYLDILILEKEGIYKNTPDPSFCYPLLLCQNKLSFSATSPNTDKLKRKHNTRIVYGESKLPLNSNIFCHIQRLFQCM